MILWLTTNPIVITLATVLIILFAVCCRQYFELKKSKTEINDRLPAELRDKSASLSQMASGLIVHLNQSVESSDLLRLDAEIENQSLLYHHKKLRSVLEVFPEGVVILDQAGTANFANNKLRGLMGLEAEEVIGKPIHQWCKNKKVLSLLVRYEGNVTRLRRSESVEFTPEDQLSKTLSVSVSPISLPTKPEVTIGILVLFSDITAEALAKRSRDDFIAHISHELKSPLNVIKLYSELLLDTGDDPEQRVSSINVINDEVERVSNLITDLLNITRLEVGNVSINRERIRFRDLITDVFEKMSRNGEENGIHFELDLPQSLSHLSVDKDLLRIALNNILSNAIKYNKPGGLVRMEAVENNDSIILKISDTGIGVLPEHLDKIFEKFYRSDDDDVNNCNGHGLGLSLAHEIISLHNGSLTVESEKGKGTTFILEIGKTSTLLKEAV